MASTIITKYGSGAPLASDLVRGELAVDTENKRLYTEDSGGSVVEIGTNPTTLAVDTDTLVVDAANNRVGIGTTSPAKLLETVATGAGSDITALQVRNNSSNTSTSTSIRFVNSTVNTSTAGGAEVSAVRNANDGGALTLKTAADTTATLTERMRIDSSGNLLVGCTSAGASNGVTLHSSGYIQPRTNTGIPAIYADREGSDGSIIELRKDGAPVGSIGTDASRFKVKSNSLALYLENESNKQLVWGNVSSVPYFYPQSDNDTNLGYPTQRFKDLYLSGGAYLGGTGAANYLDDYEEGTFTPQVWVGSTQQTLSRADGGYVKIGDYVFYQLAIIVNGAISGSGAVQIRNFPFNFGGFGPASNARASGSVSYTTASIMPIGLLGGVGTSVVEIYTNSTAGTAGAMSTTLQGSDLVSGWNMHFTIQTRIA